MPPLSPPARRQWRSLDEAAADPAFLARVAGEFPGLADALAQPASRRRVLRLLGASLALAGVGGCGDAAGEDGKLVPAVIGPPDIEPGLPNRYATASLGGGSPVGIVVTHQMGRPLKVEGNPEHPASLGATDIFAQAVLLDFYDPDRAQGLAERGVPRDRPTLLTALAGRRAAWAGSRGGGGGAGLRILTGTVLSPTLARQIEDLRARLPDTRWHRWDPLARVAPERGAALAYGRAVEVVPRAQAARVVVGLDSDLISAAPGHLAHARGFASRRNPTRGPSMSRVYAIEASPTLLGTAADHRIIAAPGARDALLGAIAAAVLDGGRPDDARAAAIADDLLAAPGEALLHAGPELSAEAQALVLAINERLGGRDRTFALIEPVAPAGAESGLEPLLDDMRAGRVSDLIVLGTNPAFSASGQDFEAAMARVPFSLVLAPAADETARAATWFVPAVHEWEGWSDTRAFDGTVTILQPQALPLYGGMSAHALLAWLAGPEERGARDLVRETWALGEAAWRSAVGSGVMAGTASPRADAVLRPAAAAWRPSASGNRVAVLCRPDPNLLDGRHANNAWLQELPRPLTKLVWDNPLLIAPAWAAREHLANGDEVRLAIGGRAVRLPVFAVPGQADGVVIAQFGYGRRVVGGVGAGTGFDVFALLGATGEATLERTGRRHALASTDHHDVLAASASPDGIVRHVTLAQVRAGLARAPDPPSLYPDRPTSGQKWGQKWGMSIDLNACIGCNACVIACQAENNIPTVGRAEVLNQREMHWLRVDRYYEGGAEAPDAFFQPMLCQHCEEAPCEVVCPVGATVHDSEGLNVMVYNRCVGTRFCSNNCPYKVRRFNFGAWAREEARPPISRNPDVTVRARGVMEKCTFCVQRIAAARVAADIGNRAIADGEVITACQAACPTRAFSFGNVADPDSEVSQRKGSALDYAVLADQATHPRVTYEARVRNPNPVLDGRS